LVGRRALSGFALVFALAIFFQSLPLARAWGVNPGKSASNATTPEGAVVVAQATGGNQPSPAGCRVTGCNGELCSDKDIISICEWRPEYACYKFARCEVQTDGKCGWTMGSEFNACLKNPPSVKTN